MDGVTSAANLSGSIDFVVISIREDEFRAVLRYFRPLFECRGRRTYDICEFKASNSQFYRAALIRTAEQGHLAAQATASDAIADLSPAWIVLVGIGGAVPETEFSLGDVVVATRLHDFSLTAAVATGVLELDARGGPVHKAVQDIVIRLPVLESRLDGWNEPTRLALDRPNVASTDEHFKGDERWKEKVRQAIMANFGTSELAARAPKVLAAAMASGNMLMKDPNVLQSWLETARSIKAVEMELPGVYEAARSVAGDVPVLAIRGISDVVGFSRDPKWTAYACASAASFAASFLELGLFDARPKGSRLEEKITAIPDEGMALKDHLDRLRNWSSQFQFNRMPSARDVDEQTIPLSFSGTPRRFRTAGNSHRILTEAQLLESSSNLIILGPPGAGKTTTLKRLCRLIFARAATVSDLNRIPLLVRLRDCNQVNNSDSPLLYLLADEFNLEPTVLEVGANAPNKAQKIVNCKGGRADRVLPKILNDVHATLFLDGLDEVNPAIRNRVEADIGNLLASRKYFRIVLTCRTGEHIGQLGYVDTIEVCDLTDDDIASFAAVWLSGQAEEFLASLASKKLKELARRPLFLAHMLNIYHLGGYLPEQPYEIYELITLLCIREWDREQRIARTSQYADFGAEKKLRFLSALAFELTYISRAKVFSERDLVTAYKKIRMKFDLPENEATTVAAEIQTHTGIIAEVGFASYEFSHLTIQEYLAADNLVRSPFPSKKVSLYLQQNPAPLAIATVLSSDPALWLAGVLMNQGLIAEGIEGSGQNLPAFLDRLQLENPIFIGGDALGLCIVGLCFRASDTESGLDRQVIERHIALILGHVAARRSFSFVVVRRYSVVLRNHTDSHFIATKRSTVEFEDDLAHELDLPDAGRISRAWLEANFMDRELMLKGISVASRR